MSKWLLLVALVGLMLTASVRAADEEQKPEKGRLAADPEATFKKLDADSDGKVTKEEFKKGLEQIKDKLPRQGQGGDKVVDFLFKKLDTNSDDKLTLDEFKKLKELREQRKNP